jgi:hypothetical protein
MPAGGDGDGLPGRIIGMPELGEYCVFGFHWPWPGGSIILPGGYIPYGPGYNGGLPGRWSTMPPCPGVPGGCINGLGKVSSVSNGGVVGPTAGGAPTIPAGPVGPG